MYLRCPHKFYLRYIKRFKTRPSIYLIRGQIVHRTLHEFHKNHLRILPTMPIGSIQTELLKTFNRLWDQAQEQFVVLNMDETELERFHQQSERMLFNFSQWLLRNEYKCPDFSELRLFSKDLRLMGIIDAVHQDPGKTIIIDYKTSQKPLITDDINRQAAIYALLYEDRYQEIPEAVWIHFLIDPGDPVPIHIDEHLMDYGKLLIDSVRKKTMSTEEIDYPCTCGGYCERDLIKP